MTRRPFARPAVVAVIAAALLTGCAPEGYDGGAAPAPSATASGTAAPSGSATPVASPSPSPSGTAEASPEIPRDCRAILTEAVLAQLEGTPLNDPGLGESTGVQPDGSLVCVWRDPGADTTGLTTTISKESMGPALDRLNALVATEGFTCFTPDEGTRCEKTWPNSVYPVTDGRTLFYRSGLLIDTVYSNLAPAGYTDAIIRRIFG